MKKVILFLILLLIPVVVNASDGPFSKAFSTSESTYTFYSVPFSDGYVFLEVGKEDSSKSFLKYYDEQGKLKKEIAYGQGEYVYTLFTKGNYLYVLKSSAGGYDNKTLRYDSTLTLLNELTFVEDLFYPFVQQMNMMPIMLHINYAESISFKDDNIYLTDWYSENAVIIKDDLSSYSIEDLYYYTNEEWDDYVSEHYPAYAALNEITDRFEVIDDSDTINYATPVIFNDDYYFANSRRPTCRGASGVESACYEDKIYLIDKDFNLVWEKELKDEIEAVQYAIMLDDYIVISALARDNNYLQIYDYEGNLIQEFSTGSGYLIYGALYKIPNGFIATVSNKNPLFYNDGFIIGDDTITNLSMAHVLDYEEPDPELGKPFVEYNEIYVFNNAIETATNGKGSINTPTRAYPGEVVTIQVTPEKGYTLSELIVIDEAGNQLPVINNTFVMGESKVIVRAVFVPENPNTGNFGLAVFAISVIISGFILILQKKKLDFLK